MSGSKPTGKHDEKRLSAAFVRNVTDAGFYADGHGLYLKVTATGARRWVQRLVIHGKRRDMSIGPANLVTLVEARERALEQRKLARAGGDPIAVKKRSTAILTFEEAARNVHELNAPTWRNAKHGQQWLNTMSAHVFPAIGSKRIDTITGADVLNVLTPIWHENPETARRVKQRIGTVMKWAMAQGWRGDNPAETISAALPKHDRSLKRNHPALPYAEVGDAIEKVRASGAAIATKLAFEFLVLTATRPGETLKATWTEIDLEKAEWTIPADRMKAKRIHRVPLPPRAVAILSEAMALKQRDNDVVFPSARTGKPLSDMTLSKLMKELGIPAVPHGFRTSFRVWAGETTAHPHEVMEAALAHTIKNKAEAAYARTDLLEKRRALMAEWSLYLKDI